MKLLFRCVETKHKLPMQVACSGSDCVFKYSSVICGLDIMDISFSNPL